MTQTLNIIGKNYTNKSLEIHSQGLDWNCLLKKLQRESLIPLLYSDLSKLDGNMELIPDDAKSILEEEYFSNAGRNILL